MISLIGQSITGQHHRNEERILEGDPPLSYARYLEGGEFISVTMENRESEFLQMGWLRAPDHLPFPASIIGLEERDAPYPVRRGGALLKLYEHSLSMAFVALFLVSF